MRLLTCSSDGGFAVTENLPDNENLKYAILSHTWEPGEVTFKDLVDGTGNGKAGYNKIRFCAELARCDGYQYFWVDTCCINKSDQNELSEAINSMFRWYQKAARCYVFLSDVSITDYAQNSQQSQHPWETAFRKSRWFTRGWTLQELLAPASVEFFTREHQRLGDKSSLEQLVHEITGVAVPALRGGDLSWFDVDERFKWADKRKTTREEDWAYCLLGIFGVSMPLIYGEGRENAIRRLKREIKDPKDNIPSYPLVSIGPVKTFVEREALQHSIREQLCRPYSTANKVGVWGMGGVGKSQLALSYLQKYRQEYAATFWIKAGKSASIDQDFLSMYRLIFKASAGAMPLEEVIQSIHGCLLAQPGTWLFVFDGADELLNADSPDFVDLSRYILGSPHVHVIVTSRNSTAQDLSTFEGVHVGELEEKEAMELFVKCAKLAKDETAEDDVKNIVKELGYLALAVTLAGSYVSQIPMLQANPAQFISEYRQQRNDLLNQKPRKAVDQYDNCVMTTWEISYAAVGKQSPDACRFLTLLAFLDYNDIFLGLFILGSTDSCLPSWSWIIRDGLVNVRLVRDSLAILEMYSLLQQQENGIDYAMHRLVHTWGYDRLEDSSQERSQFGYAASQLLLEATQFVRNWTSAPEAKLRLVPHLAQNVQTVERLSVLGEEEQVELFDRIEYFGHFAFNIGALKEAAQMQRKVLEKRQQILGNEHPDTISAMNNLANMLGNQGKLDEAATMKREVLKKMQRILGDEHPDTISAMNNLANTLGDQGKLDEAATMLREVLKKMQQILGDEHPHTILAMNNLACTLADQGKLDEAATMLREVLKKRQQILGDEHPHTILAMNNLANTLGDQGKLDEAATMKREVLKKMQQILGDEHPHTILAMNNLACTLGDQGKLDEAATMKREVLKKRQQILGDEHPHTISAMNNLANTLGDQGKLDEAATMLREALEKIQQILGNEHPHTTILQNNLYRVLGVINGAGNV